MRIIVLEGEDAVNLIDKKTAVKPTVEVRDRNDLPVAGALVRFAIRSRAAAFNNGVRELSLTTDSLGRATVSELTPLGKGTIEIQVNASYQGQTAAATIHQTNFATAAQAAQAGKMPAQSGQSASTGSSGTTTATTTAGAAGAAGGGLSGLAIAGIVGGVAAGAGAAVVAAQRRSSGDTTTPNSAPILGTVNVSPPVGIAVASTITFRVDASDPNNDPLTYTWIFGDGASGTGQTATHVYSTEGTYNVGVNVSDGSAGVDARNTVAIRTVTSTWRSGSVGLLCGPNLQTPGQLVWTMTLSQSGNNVSGPVSAAGTCGTAPTSASGTVSGTIKPDAPRIVLPVQATGIGPGTVFELDPGVDGNTLIGAWAGGSTNGRAPATFTRQ